jgi:hypothetical protein
MNKSVVEFLILSSKSSGCFMKSQLYLLRTI